MGSPVGTTPAPFRPGAWPAEGQRSSLRTAVLSSTASSFWRETVCRTTQGFCVSSHSSGPSRRHSSSAAWSHDERMSRASSARASKPLTFMGRSPYIGWLARACLLMGGPPVDLVGARLGRIFSPRRQGALIYQLGYLPNSGTPDGTATNRASSGSGTLAAKPGNTGSFEAGSGGPSFTPAASPAGGTGAGRWPIGRADRPAGAARRWSVR